MKPLTYRQALLASTSHAALMFTWRTRRAWWQPAQSAAPRFF